MLSLPRKVVDRRLPELLSTAMCNTKNAELFFPTYFSMFHESPAEHEDHCRVTTTGKKPVTQ